MNKPIFVVKDRAIDAYGQPFTQSTAAQAVRGFTDEVNGDKNRSAVAQHPDDYDLYVIGHYDEVKGAIIPLGSPELVVRGKDLLRPQGE